MAVIETKYSVGDVVYHALTRSAKHRHPCPDCLGTKKWKTVSPAGGEYEIACPRCATSYMNDRDLSLEYTAYEAASQKLTIGSIQYNTAAGSYDSGARYMCRETGVGSGSVYDEKRLFQTEDEALEAAKKMADEQNTSTDWIVQLYNKTLSISNYQIENAKIKLAEDAKSRAGSMLWNLGYLFDQIEESEGKDDILEHIQYYRQYDWQRDKDKIANEA